MLLTQKLKSFYNAESGRSMIEMLGVLAIIGVLSIAGIAGYEFAVLKFRVNEIINELNGRAISISSLLLNDKHSYVPEDVIEDGFGDTLSIGYGVESVLSDRNSNYFEISVMNVPSDVCVQLLKSYENPIMIFADEVSYNNDTSICHSESGVVDMDFIYRNDLGEHDKCSARGYFGEEDFKCHCSGNTYIDPNNPKECLCPAGHVWDAETGEHGDCIESICPEGYFESLTAGCVPCSDETSYYTIPDDDSHKALCTASTCGRILSKGSNGMLCLYNKSCPIGQSFLNNDGQCSDCSKIGVVRIAQTGYTSSDIQNRLNLCEQCSNRRVGFSYTDYYCIHNDLCEAGKEFLILDVQGTGKAECISCDTPTSYRVGNRQGEIDLCNACKNDAGQQNRRHTGQHCKKILCDSDEFMGSDGNCYSCTNPNKIAINTGSGCSSTTCGRVEVTGTDGKTYCQIADCPTDGTHANADGSCYPCAATAYDWSSFWATRSQCEQCSNRLWIGTYVDETSTGRCNYKCSYGSQVPLNDERNMCYPCSGWGDGVSTCGTTDTAKDYCNACPNSHWVDTGRCIYNNACNRGTQVRQDNFLASSYKICASCDLVDRIKIGTHELEREVCSACATTPRFWVGAYCYRCDTAETPDVTSDEERASCLSCTGVRTISDDGKCVLIQ